MACHQSIQFLSDLHLEVERDRTLDGAADLFKFEFEKQADILALLGDIGTTIDDRLFDWLRYQLSRFKIVFYVAGNHEPYGSSLEESESRLQSFATNSHIKSNSSPELGRFIFLNRTRYDLSQNTTILGCTLWSRLNPDDLDVLRWCLNDFNRIKGLTPEVFQELHITDFTWLKQAVKEIQKSSPDHQIIVMTHHAPTVKGTGGPQYEGGPTNSAFATKIIDSDEHHWARFVKVWMFGHTHWNCDFEREGVRVVSNQRGYGLVGADGFSSDMVLEI